VANFDQLHGADGVGEFNCLVEALGRDLTAQRLDLKFLEGFADITNEIARYISGFAECTRFRR
jgi:hypothetical protein